MGLVNSAWDPLTVHNHVKIDFSLKKKKTLQKRRYNHFHQYPNAT